MIIKVQWNHIDLGIVGEATHCPIAAAMEDAGLRHALAGASLLMWRDHRGGRRVKHPKEVRGFIRRFDAGEPVEPFEFELEAA